MKLYAITYAPSETRKGSVSVLRDSKSIGEVTLDMKTAFWEFRKTGSDIVMLKDTRLLELQSLIYTHFG